MIIVFAADTPVHREAAKLNAYQRLIIISVVVRPDSETSDRSHGVESWRMGTTNRLERSILEKLIGPACRVSAQFLALTNGALNNNLHH